MNYRTRNEFIELSRSPDLIISDRLHALLVGLINGANILPIKTRHKVIGYCEYLALEHAISIEDSDKIVYQHVIECAQDKGLSKKLELFCMESFANVSEFYSTQLNIGT